MIIYDRRVMSQYDFQKQSQTYCIFQHSGCHHRAVCSVLRNASVTRIQGKSDTFKGFSWANTKSLCGEYARGCTPIFEFWGQKYSQRASPAPDCALSTASSANPWVHRRPCPLIVMVRMRPQQLCPRTIYRRAMVVTLWWLRLGI
jgi:hypothetical protein